MPRSVIWYALKLFIGSSISWDNIAGPYLEDEDHYSLIMSQLDLRCQSSLMAIGTLFDKILHTFNLLQSNFGFEFKFEFGNLAVHSVDIMKIAPLQRCYWNGSSIFLWAIGRRGFGHWLNEKLMKL